MGKPGGGGGGGIDGGTTCPTTPDAVSSITHKTHIFLPIFLIFLFI